MWRKMILCQPDNGEMALEVVDQLVRSSAVDIIAVDSVAALTPRAEIEGEIGAIQGGPCCPPGCCCLCEGPGTLAPVHCPAAEPLAYLWQPSLSDSVCEGKMSAAECAPGCLCECCCTAKHGRLTFGLPVMFLQASTAPSYRRPLEPLGCCFGSAHTEKAALSVPSQVLL